MELAKHRRSSRGGREKYGRHKTCCWCAFLFSIEAKHTRGFKCTHRYTSNGLRSGERKGSTSKTKSYSAPGSVVVNSLLKFVQALQVHSVYIKMKQYLLLRNHQQTVNVLRYKRHKKLRQTHSTTHKLRYRSYVTRSIQNTATYYRTLGVF